MEKGVSVLSTQAGVVVKAQLARCFKSMNVKAGDKVQKGQVIGLVGHTGLSSKDHLRFELLKNGEALDSIKYLPQIK